MIKAMMVDAGFPTNLWPEALTNVVYLKSQTKGRAAHLDDVEGVTSPVPSEVVPAHALTSVSPSQVTMQYVDTVISDQLQDDEVTGTVHDFTPFVFPHLSNAMLDSNGILSIPTSLAFCPHDVFLIALVHDFAGLAIQHVHCHEPRE
jgi:hypothetical protein